MAKESAIQAVDYKEPLPPPTRGFTKVSVSHTPGIKIYTVKIFDSDSKDYSTFLLDINELIDWMTISKLPDEFKDKALSIFTVHLDNGVVTGSLPNRSILEYEREMWKEIGPDEMLNDNMRFQNVR